MINALRFRDPRWSCVAIARGIGASGRLVPVAVLLTVFWAPNGAAVAGAMEDGQAAYDRKDFAAALQQWRPLADQGDAAAQADLGYMYETGTGVERSPADAIDWYRKAADQGNAYAQTKLGVSYEHGRGVRRDYAAAASWFRKAADQGSATAQYNLGFMYDIGIGVALARAEAANWYRKAAYQGFAAAEANLGALYARGYGVPKDYVQAYVWCALAAEQGDGYALENRNFIAKAMTPDQIAEAQRLARQWVSKPASRP
jgi:TPR repeat protein